MGIAGLITLIALIVFMASMYVGIIMLVSQHRREEKKKKHGQDKTDQNNTIGEKSDLK